MLKYVVAQPAVTVAVPGTGDAEHMLDNLGGGRGRLPTEEHLRRMIEFVDALPQA
jgi:aryl-alcohol dehydrogenase-like predicted oxidoreductase